MYFALGRRSLNKICWPNYV